jgi:dipeptidyl aminopeptidase/acylaminoacyl peptidase
MRRTIAAWALLASSWAVGAGAIGPRPVTLEDLQGLAFPDVTLQLSPDGRSLAYALGEAGLWLVRTRPDAIPRRIGAGFLPLWSPKGDRIAFYSVTSGDVQLWMYDIKSRTAAQLTHVEGGIDPDPATRVVGYVHDAFRYDWSPDAMHIVFASRVRAATQPRPGGVAELPTPLHGAPLVLDQNTPPDWTLSGIFAHARLSAGTLESKDGHSITPKRNETAGAVLSNQLFIVDVRSGATVRLTRDDRNYFNPQFLRDGTHVVCASSPRSGPIFGTGESDVELVEAGSGKSRLVAEGKGVRSRPSLSPDGHRIAYFESSVFVSRPVVRVQALDGSETGRDMTSALDRQVEDFAWGSDGRSIWVSYHDGLSDVLTSLSLSPESVVPPVDSSAEPPINIGSISASAGAVAWEQEDPKHVTTIQYIGRGATRPVTLLHTQPQTLSWKLGAVQVIHWKNQHGDERDGALLMPPDYVPGRLYPLIVDAYPLIGGASWTSPMGGNQAWASAGYVVFRPSPRAPHVWMNPWKSEASSADAKGPQGWQLAIDDVMSGVDEVIRRGYADPQRMCLYGFSNGGGVVNYLVTATDRFRCAVSVAGALSDWVRPALLNTGYDQLLKEWAGGVGLREDPRAYEKLSAVFQLNKVRTPMLLADGDDDGDFLLDTIEMYNGLRSEGVDVTLLRYPDQGHGFSGSAMSDFWRREMAFFDRYLRP